MKWWEGEEDGIARSFVMYTLAKYNQNNQPKEDAMAGACNMYGEEEEWV
jgi:hypothetical protein